MRYPNFGEVWWGLGSRVPNLFCPAKFVWSPTFFPVACISLKTICSCSLVGRLHFSNGFFTVHALAPMLFTHFPMLSYWGSADASTTFCCCKNIHSYDECIKNEARNNLKTTGKTSFSDPETVSLTFWNHLRSKLAACEPDESSSADGHSL